MTVILVLSASTSCTTTSVVDGQDSFKETLLSMILPLPEIPSFPELTWVYQDGLYCLDEQNVDRLLDYGENKLPRYRFEMDRYEEELKIVLDGIVAI